jgi:hypothetical protein
VKDRRILGAGFLRYAIRSNCTNISVEPTAVDVTLRQDRRSVYANKLPVLYRLLEHCLLLL